MRSGLTITVKPEVKGSRHVESNTELDVSKLGVFGKEMEEVIKQTLEVGQLSNDFVTFY